LKQKYKELGKQWRKERKKKAKVREGEKVG
jgi:hypothetical protein